MPIPIETRDRAIELGAEIINDPSGFTFDPGLIKSVMNHNAGVILNHMRGTPDSWARLGPLPDPMGTVVRDLGATVHRARLGGVDAARIVVDPGIGFGKRKEQNSELLARLGQLAGLDLPIMVGPSRKSFLAQADESSTKFATAAAVTAAILGGAHLVRVHDVAEMRAAIQIADEILKAGAPNP